MSGAIFRTDLSWPAIVADELGFTRFRYPIYEPPDGPGGIPLDLERLARGHRARGRADRSTGTRCSGPPGGSAATWTRSRTTGSGGRRARCRPARPDLPQPRRLRLGPARRAASWTPTTVQARIAAVHRDDNVIEADRRERQRPGRRSCVARAAAGGDGGPHGPRGRAALGEEGTRGGRRARDRDPGRDARRQQRARAVVDLDVSWSSADYLDLRRRRLATKGAYTVWRPVALRGGVGRAGRRAAAHDPRPPRDRRPPSRGDDRADHPGHRGQGLGPGHGTSRTTRGPGSPRRTSTRDGPAPHLDRGTVPSTRPSTPSTAPSSTRSSRRGATASTGTCSTSAACSTAWPRSATSPTRPRNRPGGSRIRCRPSLPRLDPVPNTRFFRSGPGAGPTAGSSRSTASTRPRSATASSPTRSWPSWTWLRSSSGRRPARLRPSPARVDFARVLAADTLINAPAQVALEQPCDARVARRQARLGEVDLLRPSLRCR